MLRQGGEDTIVVREPVATVGALVEALSRRIPGLAEKFDDAVLNIAVNDELILHDVPARALNDGDTVEIVPTISGG